MYCNSSHQYLCSMFTAALGANGVCEVSTVSWTTQLKSSGSYSYDDTLTRKKIKNKLGTQNLEEHLDMV